MSLARSPHIITEEDLAGEPLAEKRVGVVGYGSQGEAQALNLRDAGVDVVVGLRSGSPSSGRARDAGLAVAGIEEAAEADVVALLVPDDVLPVVFGRAVAPALDPEQTVVLAHGYAIRFGNLEFPRGVDVVLVAPMGPGRILRERVLAGGGLPAAFAVHRDATGRARETALDYGRAIGCARIGLFETSVREETEVDLFAEQAVLVGGVTRLISAAFDTLVEAGYDPAVAYMECLYELELTVGLMQRFGISGMRRRISRTALFGDLTRGGRIIGSEAREGMQEILAEIQDGRFAAELSGEDAGRIIDSALDAFAESELHRVEETVAPIAHPDRDERAGLDDDQRTTDRERERG